MWVVIKMKRLLKNFCSFRALTANLLKWNYKRGAARAQASFILSLKVLLLRSYLTQDRENGY